MYISRIKIQFVSVLFLFVSSILSVEATTSLSLVWEKEYSDEKYSYHVEFVASHRNGLLLGGKRILAKRLEPKSLDSVWIKLVGGDGAILRKIFIKKEEFFKNKIVPTSIRGIINLNRDSVQFICEGSKGSNYFINYSFASKKIEEKKLLKISRVSGIIKREDNYYLFGHHKGRSAVLGITIDGNIILEKIIGKKTTSFVDGIVVDSRIILVENSGTLSREFASHLLFTGKKVLRLVEINNEQNVVDRGARKGRGGRIALVRNNHYILVFDKGSLLNQKLYIENIGLDFSTKNRNHMVNSPIALQRPKIVKTKKGKVIVGGVIGKSAWFKRENGTDIKIDKLSSKFYVTRDLLVVGEYMFEVGTLLKINKSRESNNSIVIRKIFINL